MTAEEPEYPASRSEAALVVTGLLIFIASFLPWYGVDFDGGVAEAGVTGTHNAWRGLAAAGLLLILFSVVLTVASPLFGEDVPRRMPAVFAAVLACVGAALVVARSIDLPGLDIPGATASLRWGGWVLVVLVVVHMMISVLRVVHIPQPASARSRSRT
ncbi:MAG TPA: hypothetical protein VHE57_15875 [Mycobacteriales bacterium]|nr:hypothetical protein [Mycobacteriales bacterium]